MKRAIDTYFGADGHHVDGGELREDKDPTVIAYPQWFEDAPASIRNASPVVESATAAPGEKRSVKR
jgi:hypothetical protein